MTLKQVLFAKHFVLDHCGAAAAVRADCGPKAAQTAHELLTKPVCGRWSLSMPKLSAVLACPRRVIAELKAAVSLSQEQGNAAATIAGSRAMGRMCGYTLPSAGSRTAPRTCWATNGVREDDGL